MNPPGELIIDDLHTATLHICIYIYIYEGDDPPGQSTIYVLYAATLHMYIYIYRKEMNPPGQSIIDALHTAKHRYPPVNQAKRPCIPLHCLYIYIYIYIYI